MNDSSCELLPLFSSPVSIFNLVEDLSSLLEIKKSYKFNKTVSSGSFKSYVTDDLQILDNFAAEKEIILKYFYFYIKMLLKFDNINFKITTSWATRVGNRGFSQFHNHNNSCFSGILYFDDMVGGNLQFENTGIMPRQILLGIPEEWNLYNSSSWTIKPEKNKLIFFPSYLYHGITTNESDVDRYSLAFNFFPEGKIGSGDSSIDILINQ
jgi:hypothetical protein